MRLRGFHPRTTSGKVRISFQRNSVLRAHNYRQRSKIEAVQNFPTPNTPRNIKQFLGLAGYYRRFIKDFSARAKPLSKLYKKEVLFEWGPEEEKSFKDLRQALCESPILQNPDFEKPFTVTTDASDYAIGAVLSQEKDGMDLLVAYMSKVLVGPELNNNFGMEFWNETARNALRFFTRYSNCDPIFMEENIPS